MRRRNLFAVLRFDSLWSQYAYGGGGIGVLTTSLQFGATGLENAYKLIKRLARI